MVYDGVCTVFIYFCTPSYLHFLKFLFQTFKAQSPAPPRQLKAVLASSDLANEFHAYLADMDKTHDEYTKQTYFNFALKCNEVRKAANIKEAKTS